MTPVPMLLLRAARTADVVTAVAGLAPVRVQREKPSEAPLEQVYAVRSTHARSLAIGAEFRLVTSAANNRNL